MKLFHIVLFILISAFGFQPCSAAKMNPRAKALLRYLGPSATSKKVSPADIEKVKKRLIPILNILEETKRTNGPTPQDLLIKAYQFRKDVGPHEAMVTSATLISNWQLARAAGLFDQFGKFTEVITNGSDTGEKIKFEHVVISGNMPEFSAHLANIRIIEPSKSRAKDAGMSSRDTAYRVRFSEILDEMKGMVAIKKIENTPKMNALGQTMEQAKASFEKEMKEAGDASKKLPNVFLTGKMTSSPSHKSKNRWRLTVGVSNLSSHPTELELEWYIIGITEEKRKHYIMAKGKHPMKLRKGQDLDLDIYTASKNTYKKQADDIDGLSKKERTYSRVKSRGYVLRVKHGKEVVAVAGSGQRLLGYAEKEGSSSVSGLPDLSKGNTKVSEFK